MIPSQTTRQFWRLFEQLPDDTKDDARRVYGLFQVNPFHPSLHFKKLEGQGPIYSIRISLNYRALGTMKDNYIVWFWIGTHAEYDRLT